MMTKKLFDEKERMYQIAVICIRLGIPGMARAKQIITDYYMGGTKK